MDGLMELINSLAGQNTQNQQSNQQNNQDVGEMLNNILSNIQNNSNNQNQQNSQNGGLDLNSLLGSLTGNSNNQSPDLNSILSSLGGSGNLGNLASLFQGQQEHPRSNLLTAAKPFLDDSFVPHIDRGVRLVNLARRVKTMLGAMSGGV